MGAVLIAYCHLGESTGVICEEETAQHDGTYVNSPALGQSGAIEGDANTAVYFNELNNRVAIAGHPDFRFTSLNDLYENIRDFCVAEEKGKMIGCCSLHMIWADLAEIKSLAVRETHKGRGVGKRLVLKCLAESRRLGLKRVFALTYLPKFFKKCGFAHYPKSKLPHKIWGDCLNCPKFPDCGEISVAVEL